MKHLTFMTKGVTNSNFMSPHSQYLLVIQFTIINIANTRARIHETNSQRCQKVFHGMPFLLM